MQQTEDQELIKRFLQQERDAVRQVEDWLARAVSPFRQRLGAELEDVLQEIRVETVRLLERGAFRGEAGLKTYLWRVATHACLRRLRAQSRARLVDLDDLEEKSLPQSDSPLDHLLQRETAFLALRVLEELSEECRQMLRMILDGASYSQLSRHLQIAEGTLRVKVLRCRKRATELRERFLLKKGDSEL